MRDGAPVKLGAKALDILTVLVEHAGRPVAKTLLAARVWPGVVVSESSLRFQIVGLRRLLGDDGGGTRFIVTLPGRGYCFVAPVAHGGGAEGPPSDRRPGHAGLPPRLERMIGRDADLAEVRARLERSGFVTIVGPGGIGKTTLAAALAHAIPDREDACFVDLGSVSDPALVPSALATALGRPVSDADPTPGLVAHLADKTTLVVLDSCEHIILAAAALAERLFHGAPRIRLIATSREALRVAGEAVYALEPFACPDVESSVSLEDLRAFPATELFLERAAASGALLPPAVQDAPVIADICRRLDGIPLAIELAAGCVASYGLRGTAALLRDRFQHLHSGRRTAAPRHQTLANTLAWSCGLLDRRARRVLRRLAVFAGSFSLEAACAVVADDTVSGDDAIEAMADLVAKSLVSARRAGDDVAYRLLDTTRAYLLAEPVDPAAWRGIERRRADYFRALIEQGTAEAGPEPAAGDAEAGVVSNLRAALEWCFGTDGDPTLGIALAAAAAPFYLRLSLLIDCRRISEAAIGALDEASRGSRAEMALQTSLGVALMFTSGNSPRVETALERALDLAELFGEPRRRLRILGELHILHMRRAACVEALRVAQRAATVAEEIGDEPVVAAGQLLLGIALHIVGRNDEAHDHLVEGLRRSDPPPAGRMRPGLRSEPGPFSFDLRNRARVVLARGLWIRGFPDRASAQAHDAIAEAHTLGDTIGYSIALAGGASVFLWKRDLAAATATVERLVAHAERHALRPYRAVADGLRGEIAIRSGRIREGVAAIDAALAELNEVGYGLTVTETHFAMAEGMASLGDTERALDLIDRCERQIEEHGDLLNRPEALRIKAAIHAGRAGEAAHAESLLRESIAIARAQAALAWELRSTVSLAGLLARGGRAAEAVPSLEAVLARFAEGFDTPDLRSAHRLLEGRA